MVTVGAGCTHLHAHVYTHVCTHVYAHVYAHVDAHVGYTCRGQTSGNGMYCAVSEDLFTGESLAPICDTDSCLL